ncbi:hypothetical protein RJ639_027804 [Escallonia herrerae]|uniref:Pentatricopeptide repeat-containing protein n=1 Tax=Escallonia herrerae TaxID=1293975 RepID=A0AA89BGH8_9ASTE|nr:hypothetical protein RJ639_027804 [Escallonia herrerae]
MFMKMLEGGVDPDHIFYVTMINTYSRNGQPIEAHQLFDKMIEQGMRPNSHAYTALISGLVKKNMIGKGCLYLDRMLEDGLMPNTVFYTSLINQFLRKKEIGFALRLVDLMEKSQIDCDVVTHITLVSGVCKNITWNKDRWYGAHRKSGKAGEMLFHLLHRKALVPQNDIQISISSHEKLKFFALKLIQKIKYTTFMPNLYLYNCIISGLCWSDRMQDAYDHLDLMEREGVRPNEVTFTILIGGHNRFGESDRAIGLFNEMNAHGCVPDKNVYDTLIKGLGKTGRLLDALSLAHLMHKRGFSPSKASYEILLSALCASQLSILATRICKDILAHNFAPCRYNRNWLLCMLCKENKLNEAYMLHDIMLQRGKFVDEITERDSFSVVLDIIYTCHVTAVLKLWVTEQRSDQRSPIPKEEIEMQKRGEVVHAWSGVRCLVALATPLNATMTHLVGKPIGKKHRDPDEQFRVSEPLVSSTLVSVDL